MGMSENGNMPSQPTTGKEWRTPREEGYLIILPSDNVARIRPVALDVMISSGILHDELTPLAAKTIWTEIDVDKIADVTEMATGMAELFGVVCKAAFLEPKIVDDPTEEDEISLDDLSFEDKASVFQLAIQPARVLEKFRDKQARDVAPLPDSKDEPVEAE